ncbi:MAG: hypothetical protein AB7O78_09630 [Thermoleophilia bacterium]
MNSLTREQRLYVAAGASILFIISLFFNWFGVGDFNVSGQDAVPSWWILLIFAAVAAAVLIADAMNFELPPAVRPASWAAYLTSVCFIVTLMIFLEGDNRKFGIFLALLFSIVAAIVSFLNWREDSR